MSLFEVHLKRTLVMPALVAGIHIFFSTEQDVGGRVKPGHDG
jgi:hypothetical protein